MKTKILSASAAVALALLMVPAGTAGSADEDAEYFNGFLGDATYNAPECDPLLGQACFEVPAGASQVTITIDDVSGQPVSFYVDGEGAGDCESATYSVSPGQVIHVTANGPAFAFLDCSATTATTGTFTFSFS